MAATVLDTSAHQVHCPCQFKQLIHTLQHVEGWGIHTLQAAVTAGQGAHACQHRKDTYNSRMQIPNKVPGAGVTWSCLFLGWAVTLRNDKLSCVWQARVTSHPPPSSPGPKPAPDTHTITPQHASPVA
jgi:hypothetical protein